MSSAKIGLPVTAWQPGAKADHIKKYITEFDAQDF